MDRLESSETEGAADLQICDDLDASLRHYTEELGYAVDEVFPADAPRVVLVSRDGRSIRLEQSPTRNAEPVDDTDDTSFVRQAGTGSWNVGRAGMQYRDLLPGRLGGRVIASHIRIPDGGPVPDYVHYHHVQFQMIYCAKGWVRVVYEDQGPSFVMHAGDCVLQPPGIRHRVLECSDGLEVIEIGSPAEHRTLADRRLELPTQSIDHDRRFDGPRFVFHQSAPADWRAGPAAGFEFRDTGIEEATAGAGSAIVLRATDPGEPLSLAGDDGFQFHMLLRGSASLITDQGESWSLCPSDSFAIPPGVKAVLDPDGDALEVLRVALPDLAGATSPANA